MNQRYEVVIVGAGLTGIMAAQTLLQNGINDIIILEKEAVPGGRVATFRIDQASWDIGSQFFTVRSPLFQSYVTDWLEKGWIKKWFGDRYPRYASCYGMDRLTGALAEPLPIQRNVETTRITQTEHGWRCFLHTAESIHSRALLLTPPAPVSLRLLANGNVRLSEPLGATLASIRFQPSIVALFALHQPSAFASDNGHLDHLLPPEIERIADQQRKGISLSPVISVYMTGDWSERHLNHSDEEIKRLISHNVAPFIPPSHIQSIRLKRWEYAQTLHPVRSPFIDGGCEHPLLFAGDAFLHADDAAGRTRCESAFLSGIAAAEHLLQALHRK